MYIIVRTYMGNYIFATHVTFWENADMWPPSYFDFIRLLQDTPFLLDLARRAADITIHQSFSTSFTSILWNVAIFVWVLKRIYSREGGLAAVMKHWGNAR